MGSTTASSLLVGQSCTFGTDQIQALAAVPGSSVSVSLSNNYLNSAYRNLQDTESRIVVIDSSFLREDAVVSLVRPKAMFAGESAILEYKAVSSIASAHSQVERYADVQLTCGLYPNAYPDASP
jgi:hypothetical protein